MKRIWILVVAGGLLFAGIITALFLCTKVKDPEGSTVICNLPKPEKEGSHKAGRSMYYWKNKLELTAAEDSFLARHRVTKLYVRFFDVTVEDLLDGYGPKVVPSATVQIHPSAQLKKLQIVPTVFITLDAMKKIGRDGNEKEIAGKLYERIYNMCCYYGIQEQFQELQLDCDWTESTRQAYFKLCQCIKDKGRIVSCTIRLHQLKDIAPPVDFGVLMLYNTNDLRNPNVKNSILDEDDVRPYLKDVKYCLPLDFAYPAFEWYLRFHNNQFCEIVTSKHRADSLQRAGDLIRHESVSFEEIMRVKKAVEKNVPHNEGYGNTIVYHLDENNLKKYSDDEIETIFSR